MPEGPIGRNAVRAALFFVVAPGAVVGLVPYLLSRWRVDRELPDLIRVVGAVLIGAGLLSVVESFGRFVLRGQGTPAPMAPPTRLVVSGQYRHVRNPMYLALVAVTLGEALWLGSTGLGLYAALLLMLFHLRVVSYEEPRLAGLFGAQFAAYRQAVPRWLPRPTPWKATPIATAPESADGRTGL